MYHVETGEPRKFHSVDAREAALLGDYTFEEPKGSKKPSPEALARASFAMTGGQATPHPELLTPEERAEQRRLANEEAAKQGVQPVMMVTEPPVSHPEATPASVQATTARRPGASREAEDKK
jgi:hypothetical protein